jgi:uncharacterized protein YggE
MKRLLLFLPLILPISLFAGGGLPDKPYIYVQGKAEIQKPADIVTLKFDLVGRAPDQSKANEDVQSKANKIFALLKERKIADDDVIAEDLRSEPEFDQEGSYSNAHRKLTGYKVTRPFQTKARDVDAFPKLVNELLGIGGVEFSGIEGGVTKEKEVEPEVWQKAIANAREQAEKTLRTLNMKIDSVFAVSPVAFPQIEAGIFGDEITRLGVRSARAEEAAAPEYKVAPVTITQTVHVIYLISPAK